MIHQLIFANPKPGMSIKEFQDYWIHVHAVQFASKITQVKKYKVSRILPFSEEDPVFHGMAEMWIENEEEELASLESEAYIKGARADEPNWAAFWETVSLDTYSYDRILCDEEPEYKILLLMKRKEGIPLKVFQECFLGSAGDLLKEADGIEELTLSVVKDNSYQIGETSFDAAAHLWVESPKTAKELIKSAAFQTAWEELDRIGNSKYLYRFLCQVNRII